MGQYCSSRRSAMEHSIRARRRLFGCARNGTNWRNIATDPQLQADVQNEQGQINDDLSVLKVIPVISLGFSVKF